MKRILIVVLAVAVLAGAGVWVWSHRGKPGHEIVFIWDHSANSWPDCSATVHRKCLTGFTLTDVTDGAVISTTIPTNTRTWIYRPGWEIEPGFRHVFTLQANGYGVDGAAILSQPATVIVANPKWKFGHANDGAGVVR